MGGAPHHALRRCALAACTALVLAACGRSQSPSPYAQVDGAWRYQGVVIEGAETKTFEPLDDHYARDRTRVYYGDTYRLGQEYYSIRHERVRVLDTANPASLRVLGGGYATDARSAWFEGVPFAVRDAATFAPLDYGFARDAQTGYYLRQAIPGSDGPTFAPIDSHYARDHAHVFHADLVPGDDTHPAAVHSRLLAGAEPASFTALDAGYAKDARRSWYRGHPLGDDGASLAVLSRDYARGAARIYWRGAPVRGADAATFAVDDPGAGESDAHDRAAAYRNGERLAR